MASFFFVMRGCFPAGGGAFGVGRMKKTGEEDEKRAKGHSLEETGGTGVFFGCLQCPRNSTRRFVRLWPFSRGAEEAGEGRFGFLGAGGSKTRGFCFVLMVRPWADVVGDD